MKNETSYSNNEYYNFFAKITPNYVLKGGKTYTKGTTQTGFEIYSYQNGNINLTKILMWLPIIIMILLQMLSLTMIKVF